MNFEYCHVEFGPSHWYFDHWYFEPLPKWNFWYYELSLGILIPPIWYFDTPVGILIPSLVFWTLRWYFDTPFWYFDHWYFDLWYFDLWYFELLPCRELGLTANAIFIQRERTPLESKRPASHLCGWSQWGEFYQSICSWHQWAQYICMVNIHT